MQIYLNISNIFLDLFWRGHNGLRSIIDSAGGKDFQRLKIGIG